MSVFQNIFISEENNKLNAFIQDIISRNNQPAIHSKKESPYVRKHHPRIPRLRKTRLPQPRIPPLPPARADGEADYIVEGRSYHLRPLDIVLVGAHCLHKPVVPYHSRYERIILYLSPECLDAFSCADCALDLCFQLAREQQSDVLRLGSLTMTPLLEALSRLENAYQAGGTNDNGTDNANFESLGGSSYGSGLLLRLLFLEFMVHLDRAASENHREYVPTTPSGEKILELMRYLSEHPEEDHTIDQLAARFYISKYHMMRLFRQETGYTITEYLTEKRLQNANELLRRGTPVTEACYQSGFRNYAAFLRAYKKKYRDTPHNLSRLNYQENFTI